MTFQLSTLATGLRVGTKFKPNPENDPAQNMVTIKVSVGVGAHHESEQESGLAHLREHLTEFGGTEKQTRDEIAVELDRLKASFEAATYRETTTYQIVTPKECVPRAVKLMSELIQHPAYDEKFVHAECRAIAKEDGTDQNTSDIMVEDALDKVAYPGQAMGRPVVGNPKQLLTYTAKDIRDFSHKHYTAPNIVVTAEGDVDHEAFSKLVEQNFNELPITPAPPLPRGTYKGGEIRVHKPHMSTVELMLGFETGTPIYSKEYYAWEVLSTLLSKAESAHLYKDARTNGDGLAYFINTDIEKCTDNMFSIHATTDKEDATKLLEVVCAKLVDLRKNKISEEELNLMKGVAEAATINQYRTAEDHTEMMGDDILRYGHYIPLQEKLQDLQAVTTEDILQLCQKFKSQPSFAAYGNIGKLPTLKDIQNRLTEDMPFPEPKEARIRPLKTFASHAERAFSRLQTGLLE